MKKRFIIIILLTSLIIIFTTNNVEASYNYSPDNKAIESAESMSVTSIIDNVTLLDVDGNKPNVILDGIKDVFTSNDKVYISDTNQNKVYVLNEKFEYLESYPSEKSSLTLNQPSGLFVRDNLLYVADTENNRIIIFDTDTKEEKQIIENPDDPVFETTKFRPEKIVVDRSGRILVVARGIFEGIMEFDSGGSFARYYGTNQVQLNFLEALIYKLSSKKQKESMVLNLQTEFTSIDIDEYGYVYTIANQDENEPVKKLNFKGKNILLNNGYIGVIGDNLTGEEKLGPSNIIDIAVNDDNNRFSILDNKRGRIFTYDMEGHLLYISGGLGTQNNMLQSPSSIEYFGEKILVTDTGSKSLLVFEPTPFGNMINGAIKSYYDMDYEASKALWEEVLKENSNYFLAYSGIGKTQLRNEEWNEAIKNLKLGHDYYNYSKAYEQYRNIKMQKYLPYVIIVVFALSGFGLYKSIKSSLTREDE